MPRARSMLTEPLEKAPISRSMASSFIVRIAPLPNCFSMVETASSIALRFWPSVSARSARGSKGRTFFAMGWCSFGSGFGSGTGDPEREALEGGVEGALRQEVAAEQHDLGHAEGLGRQRAGGAE